jgi:hypothetical protein
MSVSGEIQQQPSSGSPTLSHFPGSGVPSQPTIADLILLQRIGKGAYGEVWLARTALGTLLRIVRWKIVDQVRRRSDWACQDEAEEQSSIAERMALTEELELDSPLTLPIRDRTSSGFGTRSGSDIC